MFIKLMGGVLVLVASSLIGIAFSNRYSSRPREIRKLRTSLQMLETEIIYGATPLPQAFDNIASKVDRCWSGFYQKVAYNLGSGSFYTVNDAWANAIDTALTDISLDRIDIELVKSFGNILGSSDREDQGKHFKLFYAQLNQHEEMAEEARKKSEKMYKSLGFLAGAAIFIILI